MNLDGARVAVIGGAGFIGSHVVHELLSEGSDVLVLDNLFAGKEEFVPEEAQFERLDIVEDDIGSALSKFDPDALVHLAAIHYIPYCNDHPEEAVDVNTMGTRRVFEAARDLESLEAVTFASSAAVYPPRERPNEEDSELGPMDIYGKTKLLGEDLLQLFYEDTDVSSTAMRLFNVYGNRETNMHLIPAVLEQVEQEETSIELGNMTPKRDFIHVTDVARAFTTALKSFDDGFDSFNVGTGVEHSVRDVAEMIIDASRKNLSIEQDQERVRESDRPFLQADISKIQSDMGWQPEVTFEDGITRLVNDYLTQ
jgi:UDP-glucose 4-epimerase